MEPAKSRGLAVGEVRREVGEAEEVAVAAASLELLDFLNTYHFPPKRLSCCSS